MTRWKKDAKEFEVTVNTLSNRNGSDSQVCVIPKPIIELLNHPSRLKFKIVGKTKRIEIQDV